MSSAVGTPDLDGRPHPAPNGAVVVIPAHNEQDLLPRCLESVLRAAAAVPHPVRVLVVLDACVDGSARLIPPSVSVLRIEERNVGAARAAGFAAAARPGEDLDRLWYATTDADTVVPADWLTDQWAHASAADVTVGTVAVRWRERPAAVRAEYDRRYRRGRSGASHRHVHGANLGFRAAWYHRVGGFAPRGVGEDVDLVRRLSAAGARIVWNDRPAVLTSDRRDNRVAGGFGGHLTGLADAATDCA